MILRKIQWYRWSKAYCLCFQIPGLRGNKNLSDSKFSILATVSCKLFCLTVMLEKILESPLDCKEIQPVHSKGDRSWVFFGKTDAKAETPVLWPPHVKSWLTGKDFDAGRDCGQEEKGTTEDEMAGWHHRLNGCEFEWTLGFGDGQGGLACCNSWGCKESDTTELLYWTERIIFDICNLIKLELIYIKWLQYSKVSVPKKDKVIVHYLLV